MSTQIEESRPVKVPMWEDDGTKHVVTAFTRRVRAKFAESGWSPWQEERVLHTVDSGVRQQEDGTYLLMSTGARLRTRTQLPEGFLPE